MDDVFDQIDRVVWQTMAALGPQVVASLRERISTPVGRDVAGNVTVRSRAGEPPRLETGRLWHSIEYLVDGGNGGPVDLVVFSDAEYAPGLEFGTSRTAARPAWGPTLMEWGPRVEDALADAVRQALSPAPSQAA